MEGGRGRVFLLPLCFEFRPGWAQCWLFALEGPLVNSFLPGLKAGSLEREVARTGHGSQSGEATRYGSAGLEWPHLLLSWQSP